MDRWLATDQEFREVASNLIENDKVQWAEFYSNVPVHRERIVEDGKAKYGAYVTCRIWVDTADALALRESQKGEAQ